MRSAAWQPLPGFPAPPVEEAPAPKPRPRHLPENHDPPAGLVRFYVRLVYGSGRRREVPVDKLSPEQLRWVARTVLGVVQARAPADRSELAVQELESS